MTLHKNNFEGQTAGVNATVANSANSGSAWTSQAINGGTLKYTSTRSVSGSISLLATTDGSTSCFFDDTSFNNVKMAVSDCLYYPGLPNGTQAPVYSVRTAAGVAAQLVITATGKLQVQNAAGDNAVTAANTLVAGHWYRIEIQVLSDATAGTTALQYYVDNTGNAIESLSASNVNTRGGNITYVRRGCNSPTYTNALPYWNYDNIQSQDNTTVPIGALTVTTSPTAAYTYTINSATVLYDASTSSSVAPTTLVSYSWDFGDGTMGSGNTISHTYGTSGTYSVSLTVTDSNGQTNVVTKSITIAVRSNELYVYHGGQWVNSTLYAYSGGQWTPVQ